jgi:hypothetical protein
MFFEFTPSFTFFYPIFELFLLEFFLVFPWLFFKYLISAHPVAKQIFIAIEKQDLQSFFKNVFNLLGHILILVLAKQAINCIIDAMPLFIYA